MSRELIVSLRREAAFDPTPLPEDLAALHVPFDELGGDGRVERALNEAAQAAERIAVIGTTGCGKSSVLSYTLTAERGFAALPISVAPESDETVTDPGNFAQHVVRVISTWAAELEVLSPEQRDHLLRAVTDQRVLPSRAKQTHAGIGLQLPWLVSGELARDIRRELEPAGEVGRSAVEYLEALRRLVRLVRTIELEPLLVIDDSDRWLRRGEPRGEIIDAFFGRVVRELADLEIGFAVAVHETYLLLPEYQESTPGVLSSRVDVPRLTATEQLERIVDHRVRAFVGDEASEQILEEEALIRLWEFYEVEADHSLRTTLQILHTAVTEAAQGDHEAVRASMIEPAIAAWVPARNVEADDHP
jgi:hypothetical protein